MSDLISASEIETLMKKVPEWELEEKSITRSVEFDEFLEGIDFVDGVAEIAEEAQHHPDIDIRWRKVHLLLTTHSAGGLTAKDFELAARFDALV